MEVPAVELDDHLLGLEQRVDLVPGDAHVDQRDRETVLASEALEAVLELRARGAGRVFDERP